MFDNNTFDVVICLGGALSHIVNRRQREKAIDELVRAAKKNAPIFVSVIGRLATWVCALVYWPEDIEIDGLYQRIYDTGTIMAIMVFIRVVAVLLFAIFTYVKS